MKSGKSPLNPYAAPFLPSPRQRTETENIAPLSFEDSQIGHEAAQCKQLSSQGTNRENLSLMTSKDNIDDATTGCKHVEEDKNEATKISCDDLKTCDENSKYQLPNLPSNDALNFNISGLERQCDSEDNIHSSEDLMPHKTQDGTENDSTFEDYELDLAYLAGAFPSISEQSLVDVYLANAGDLEASIDMLIQLELQDDDLLRLPHTLNGMDVSESSSGNDPSGIKKTTTYGEASGSSHSSDPASGSEQQ